MLQVITSGEEHFAAAGRKLMEIFSLFVRLLEQLNRSDMT